MQVVFSSSAVALFPDVIEDGGSEPITDEIDPDDVKIDRIVCTDIGESRLRPHLVVSRSLACRDRGLTGFLSQILLANGSLAVYEAFPSISAASSSSREASLGVRFVKVATRRLSMPVARRGKRGAGEDELPPPRREFVPFSRLQGLTGLFATGEDPFWILATDHGPARLFDHADKGVYGFSSIAFEAEEAQYMIQSKAVSGGTAVRCLREADLFSATGRLPRFAAR
jgi:cleavage and polyadenylation specificity factor subunit 1